MFYTEETYEQFFEHPLDYVIDASDTIHYKIHLMKECLKRNVPLISSMGAANKTDPTRFQIADISKPIPIRLPKSSAQGFAKRALKRRTGHFSDESPIVIREDVRKEVGNDEAKIRKAQMPPSSNAWVPSVGLIMGGHVVMELLKEIDIKRVKDK